MIKKLCDALYKVTGVINVALITAIILFTLLQVISRYVISFSIPWAQELTVYAMVWMVLLGCSMGMRKKELARLSLLVDLLPNTGRQIMRIINDLIITVFLAIILWVNHGVIVNAMPRLSGMMRIPMGYVNLALSAMAALIILYGLADIYDATRALIAQKRKGGGR